MANLGRISGQLLKDNLTRNGHDLSFDDDLLNLNVNSRVTSINTDVTDPARVLLVNGKTLTTNLDSTSLYFPNSLSPTFSITSNEINSDGILNLVASSYVNADRIDTDKISITGNVISTLGTNQSLSIEPNGSGTVEIDSPLNITGNLRAYAVSPTEGGNIILSGTSNIIFGSDDQDTISFASDINSDIIPDQNDVYSLGSNPATGGKRWEGLYSDLINGQSITLLGIASGDINQTLRQGKTWYVATNGSDANVGDHQEGPFATLGYALSQATSGDTVFVYPGTYTEITPLTVPVGVHLKGESLRSVTVVPDASTTTNNVFLLNGECTVSNLTVKDFYAPGYAFSFATGFTVSTRSPYVQDVSVITAGSVTSLTDPRGFNSGDAGGGAYVDGSQATVDSKEATMLFHSVTFITPGVDALVMTNGVRVEWLNSFTYFANRGLYAFNGTLGLASQGVRFGAEIRSIGSASVYGNYGAVADGADTLMYLINHNFAYIGAGLNSSNDPTLNVAENETVESNDGKIYYQSVDNKGNFNVGDAFKVSYETGSATINGIATSATGITSINFANAGQETIVNSQLVSTGKIKFTGNEISSLSGAVNLSASTSEILLNANTDITDNLIVDGNFNIDGTLTVGNQFIDVVTFNAPVEFDFRPELPTYVLGASDKRWSKVYTYSTQIDDTIVISTNNISTITTNTNLELTANGTGKVTTASSDVEIAQTLDVSGTSTVQDLNVTGAVDITGNIIQAGSVLRLSYENATYIANSSFPGTAFIIDATAGDGTAIVTLTSAGFIGSLAEPGYNALLDLTISGTFDGDLAYTYRTFTLTSNWTTSDGGATYQATTTYSGSIITYSATPFYFIIPIVVSSTYTDPIYTQTGNRDVSGTLTVTSDVFFDDINFIDNRILTTIGNNDLELYANGTGIVSFNENLRVVNNLTIGTLTSNGLENSLTITADTFTNNVISTTGNNISTITTDTDLILSSNGTGKVSTSLSDVTITQTLDVNDTSTLHNLNVTGLVDITGDYNQTGDYTQTGNRDVSGTLTVTSDVYFDDINFIDNRILTTIGNNDLQLEAAGTGIVLFNENLRIVNNLLTDTLVSNTIGNSGTITSGLFSVNNIEITSNTISVTVGNDNLELTAAGSGLVYFPTDPVLIDNNLEVLDTAYLKNTVINGLLDHTGSTTQTGNITSHTGDFDLTGNLTTTGTNAWFKDVRIVNNQIYTSLSNSNLILSANGSGIINLNDYANFGATLTVSGLTSTSTLTSSGTILSDIFTNNDIEIYDNIITTTVGNNNLILTANGTGGPKLEKVKFNANTISTDSSNFNITLTAAGKNVLIDAASALKVPVGTTANRSSLVTGDVRFNTTDNLYRGYSSARVSFGGVYSDNLATKVLAHPTNNTLNFTNNNTSTATINSTGLSVVALQVDDLNFNDNTISSTATNTDITFAPNGTGHVNIGDISIASNELLNLNSTQPLILQNTASGYVKFTGTYGIAIPSGDNSSRPLTPETGDLRWNTQLSTAEVFNGIEYQTLSGTGGDLLNAEEVQEVTNLWALVLG